MYLCTLQNQPNYNILNHASEHLLVHVLGKFRTRSVAAFILTTVYIYRIVIYHLKGTYFSIPKIPYNLYIDN